jgi:signal peptidase II
VRGGGEGDCRVVPDKAKEKVDTHLARWLPFAIAATVIVLDRITKIYIRGHLGSFDSMGVIPGWLRIIHTENPGAAFGMFADGNPAIRSIVLVGVSFAVLLFVINVLVKRSGSMAGTLSRIALGLILGGAIGNLYDRIAAGTVTDFLEVYNGAWTFPAFNAADSAITVGAVFLLIDLLRPNHKSLPHRQAQPPAEF